MRRASFFRVPGRSRCGSASSGGLRLRARPCDRQTRTSGGPTTPAVPPAPATFEATQITRANVSKLAIAWTYPFGETNSEPARRQRRDLWPRTQRVAACDRREDRKGNLDPRGHAGDDRPRHELLGEQGRQGSAADLRDERLPRRRSTPPPASRSTAFGKDGVVDLREGLGRDPPPSAASSPARRADLREPDPARLGHRRGLPVAARRSRAYDVVTGKLVWQFHTVPHPGEFGYETWPKDAYKYVGGVNTWGEITVDAKRGIAYFPIGSPTYDYYGADRPARTCSAPRSSRSTRAPASACGTSRWSTTISGISTATPRRSSRRSSGTARASTSSRWPARPGSSTCSIA